MFYRKIKNNSVSLSEIGIGTWVLDKNMWGGYDYQELLKAFFSARELGINFIDTAAAYGEGEVEQLIARLLSDIGWKDVFIATKITPLVTSVTPLHPDQAFPRRHIIESVEHSLRRLQLDAIPLIQLHTWDDTWLGQGEWLETLLQLKRQGKVLNIGLSLKDHAPDSAIEVVRTGYIDFVQLIYNIFDQSPRKDLFDLCLFHGVSVIIRSALYEGVLTGKYNAGHEFDKNDWRNNFFSGGHLAECAERVQSIYDTIPGIDCNNIAEYALKFALSHPAVTSVIVGMRSARHVYDNARASSDFLLTPDLIKEMGVFDWQST